jgi:hypothetical protein
MNFDANIHSQQAPFSGTDAEEQAIKIQSSIALLVNIFSFYFDFLLHLLTLIILKKKKKKKKSI